MPKTIEQHVKYLHNVRYVFHVDRTEDTLHIRKITVGGNDILPVFDATRLQEIYNELYHELINHAV